MLVALKGSATSNVSSISLQAETKSNSKVKLPRPPTVVYKEQGTSEDSGEEVEEYGVNGQRRPEGASEVYSPRASARVHNRTPSADQRIGSYYVEDEYLEDEYYSSDDERRLRRRHGSRKAETSGRSLTKRRSRGEETFEARFASDSPQAPSSRVTEDLAVYPEDIILSEKPFLYRGGVR